jgi:predicted O-methyltransferase YrrM
MVRLRHEQEEMILSRFDDITRMFGDLPHMKEAQASVLRDLIEEEDAHNILEIGFFQGKSSAYIAAILEDRGSGRLVTIDQLAARDRNPNIVSVLSQAGLSGRVDPVFSDRSYTWELQRMIRQSPRPVFDLCYFDGGHQWDNTGFGVLLVDMLLKPGGIIVLDDMNWSMATSNYHKRNPEKAKGFSEDERQAQTVRRVWETILPHLGYSLVREVTEISWGIARKKG